MAQRILPINIETQSAEYFEQIPIPFLQARGGTEEPMNEQQQPTFSGNYGVCTFEGAQIVARRLYKLYEGAKSQYRVQGAGTYGILAHIYDFTHAMRRQDKIERIHQSSILRIPHSAIQQRSDYAVVMLLLSLENPTIFNRHWRHRVNTALLKAAENRIPPNFVVQWVHENGGIDQKSR